jgi:hypothetical protein
MNFTKPIIFVFFILLLSINLVDTGFAQKIENNDQIQKNESVEDWSAFFPEIPNCVRETSEVRKYHKQYTQEATYTIDSNPTAEKIIEADKRNENRTVTPSIQFDIFPKLKNQCGYIRIQKGLPPKPKEKEIPYGGEPIIRQTRIKGYKANIVVYGCDYIPCDLGYFDNLEVHIDKNKVIKFHIRKDIAQALELAARVDYEKLKLAIDNFRKIKDF